jgi:hypothetical protein
MCPRLKTVAIFLEPAKAGLSNEPPSAILLFFGAPFPAAWTLPSTHARSGSLTGVANRLASKARRVANRLEPALR